MYHMQRKPTHRDAIGKATANVVAQGEFVKYDQQGMPQLEVWLEDETIWLTQKQMGELFDVKENTITYHIKEITVSGELDGMATTRKIRVVRDQRIGKLEKRMTAAERSIKAIVYTLMPPLRKNRTPIGFGQTEDKS